MKKCIRKMRKGDVRKLCEKNRAKNSAKICAKKKVKNRQKNPSGNTKKCAEKFCEQKKHCWDRRQNHFLSAKKNFTEFFFFFGPGCLQPFVGGGRVCDSWDPGIVGTGACVCIHPSLPARFPDEAHLVLAYFWQVLLLLVLALD